MSSEAFLDPRFVALPRLIRDATNPNVAAGTVRRFMDELFEADRTLFSGVLQFFSREGHGFVLVHEIGPAMDDARTWPRWPLKRLFATRRSSLITNPITKQRALAVPFSVGNERHVVVAPLATKSCDAAQQVFLDTLQSAAAAAGSASAVNERVPRFVWLGINTGLGDRLAAIAARRAWPLVSVPTFGHALLMLEQDDADVAVLEAASLNGELASLRALRHAAKIGDAPIVYFTDREPEPEIETLVDFCLSPTAGESQLLRALKSSAALVSQMRAHALRESVQRMEHQLRGCRDFGELAHLCAQAALLLGADIASVMLADEAGGVHAAHVPFHAALGDHWPTPFMTGETIAHTYAGDAFFEQAFDDAEYAKRVRALQPISAGVFPIHEGGRIAGTLVALATHRAMFQPEFDALSQLCERTAHVAAALEQPHARGGPWRRAMIGETMVEAFEGVKARASMSVRAEEGRTAVVLLERGDPRRAASVASRLLADPQTDLREIIEELREDLRGALVALIEGEDRLRYACEGLPMPLRVPLNGPVAATRRAESCECGTIRLGENSATLLYSSEFASQIQTAQIVAAVQRTLRTSRSTLARSLPGLGSSPQRLAFACITMLSSDVDSPRPPAIV
jgi:hypothetical protein